MSLETFTRQYNFQTTTRSTTTQILEFCTDWRVHVSAEQKVDAIYLDFSKTFDSVVHSKLINTFGITGNFYDLLGSQSVRVTNINSKSSTVLTGFPQGSALGPILFLIFINDTGSVSDNHNVSVKLFAGDIQLNHSIDVSADYLSLQDYLNLIYKWSLEWRLGLSPTFNPCYSIGNTLLNNASSVTDLAVIVDQHLTFLVHVDQMCVKANQWAALILRCFRSRHCVLLTKAFVTYVRPILDYVSYIWSQYKIHYIYKIESVPKQFTKRLNDLQSVPYLVRLSKLSLDGLELRRLRFDLV